jgi:AcrR family transcriptional regulator
MPRIASRPSARRRAPRPGGPRASAAPAPDATAAAVARGRILQSAEERFLSHGFSAITMDDLAAELGMSKKTLYQHFPSKESLLSAVLEARLASIGREVGRLSGDPTRDFTARLDAVLGYLSQRLAEIQPPFLHDLRRNAPDTFRKIEEFRRQTIPIHFGELINEGTRQGMIRADLNARLVGELILNAVQAMLTPEALARFEMSAQEVFCTILSVTLEGIMTSDGRKAFARSRARAGR